MKLAAMAARVPVNGAPWQTATAAVTARCSTSSWVLVALLIACAAATSGATPTDLLQSQGPLEARRQLLAAPPRAVPSQWYGQHLLACLTQAKEQLLEAAQPNWSPKTTARCGGFISAARGIGSTSQLASFNLQAGSGMVPGDTSRATIFPGVGNALVSLSATGALMGMCADTSKGARCADVPANITLFHLPDPSPIFNISLAPEADGALRNPAIVSSLVWLDVEGRKPGSMGPENDDQLPCNPPGSCKATIYVPLTRPLPSGAAYACLRGQLGPPPYDAETALQVVKSAGPTYPWQRYWSLPSGSTAWWVDDTYGDTAPWVEGADPHYGVVPCVTSYPGVYVVVAYTSTPLSAGRQGVDVTRVTEGKRRSYTYTLAADYTVMAANAAHLNYVREFTVLQVSNATGLPSHHINVTDISKGSVVVAFDVWVPKAFTAAQDGAVHAAVMAPVTYSGIAAKLMALDIPLTSTSVVAKAVQSQGPQQQAAPAPSRAAPSPAYGQHLLACLAEAQEQLLKAAQSDWSPKATARCGGFISASRGMGSTSKLASGDVQLQAGSGMVPGDTSRATIFPGVGNALVSLSGTSPLMGLCADTSKGARCADVPASITLFHLPDPSPFFNTSLAPNGDGALLNPAIVSSLVWLDVEGRKPGSMGPENDDQLPCNPPGSCRATVYVPLTRPLPSGAAYACLRGQFGPPPIDVEYVLQMEKSEPGSPWARYWSLPSDNTPWLVDEKHGRTRPWLEGGDPPYGSVPCVTSYPGVYVVVAYTSTPLPAEQQGVDMTQVKRGKRLSYTYTLAADYTVVAANADHLTWVREFTVLQVSNATGLPSHHINVTGISKGSVVVAFDVWVPKAFTAAQTDAVHAAVLDPTTGSWLASKVMALGVPLTSPTVVARAVRPQGLSLGVIIGIAVGGGVALIAGVVLATMLIKRRRQRAVALAAADSPTYAATQAVRARALASLSA